MCIYCLKTTLWSKVSRNYWLTFLLTFLAGRLTFLLTFSYMCSFCLLSAAAGSFVACLLALSAVCCCCFVRCMATGSYWFSIRFCDMLVAAAGSSSRWLLKPYSAYVRLTFCLRFYCVKTARSEWTIWTVSKTIKTADKACRHNIKPIWKHMFHTCVTYGLRFCLRFWGSVLRFCLRFPTKCEHFSGAYMLT